MARRENSWPKYFSSRHPANKSWRATIISSASRKASHYVAPSSAAITSWPADAFEMAIMTLLIICLAADYMSICIYEDSGIHASIYLDAHSIEQYFEKYYD